MKSILLATLSLCFVVNVVALTPHVCHLVPCKIQPAGGVGLTTTLGTVQDGGNLRFITDQRAWNVDNPETLRAMKDIMSESGPCLSKQGLHTHHRSEPAHRSGDQERRHQVSAMSRGYGTTRCTPLRKHYEATTEVWE